MILRIANRFALWATTLIFGIVACGKDIDESEAIKIAESAALEYVGRHPGDPGGFDRVKIMTLPKLEGWEMHFCRVGPAPRYLVVVVGKNRQREISTDDYCH